MPYNIDDLPTGALPLPDSVNYANKPVMMLFCLVAVVLSIYPVRYCKETRNWSALNMLCINNLLCTSYIINACLWGSENFETWFRGYGICDIEAAFKYPLTTALACSLARFIFDLSKAFTPNAIAMLPDHLQNAERWRQFLWAQFACFGYPIVQLAFYSIVTTARYSIAPVVGCLPQFDNDFVWLVLYVIPILLLEIIACFYLCKFIQIWNWK